jgi:hypothetical protein
MAYTSNIALEVQQEQLAAMSPDELRDYEEWLAGPESDEDEEESKEVTTA